MKKLTKKQIKEILELGLKANKKEIEKLRYSIYAAEDYLELVHKFRNSYFWTPRGNASSRRRQEEENTLEETVELFDKKATLKFEPTFTNNNVYVYKNLTVNEVKKLLKEAQNKLYVLTTDKHKDLIERIDNLIETERSVNNNDLLFDKKYIREFKKEVKNMKEELAA